MIKNINDRCRIFRATIGVVIIVIGLFVLNGINGALIGLIALAVGVVMIIVAAIGICPLFIPLGIDQTKIEKK